ncbi:MAG: hypothetical protein K2N03_01115, partial [Muribaculaceae bacterium]|nr:hypothetical protein [Muribaculaceae bacterium]
MKNIISSYIQTQTMLLSVAAALGLGFVSCGGEKRAAAELTLSSDSVPKSVKEFVTAVLEEDSVRFSAIVSYPLQRPYPLGTIETPEKMQSY